MKCGFNIWRNLIESGSYVVVSWFWVVIYLTLKSLFFSKWNLTIIFYLSIVVSLVFRSTYFIDWIVCILKSIGFWKNTIFRCVIIWKCVKVLFKEKAFIILSRSWNFVKFILMKSSWKFKPFRVLNIFFKQALSFILSRTYFFFIEDRFISLWFTEFSTCCTKSGFVINNIILSRCWNSIRFIERFLIFSKMKT